MSEKRIAATITDDRELVITRVFDAPRELVFRAWAEPKHLEQWQGAPQGFIVTTLAPVGAVSGIVHGNLLRMALC